jgi:hypothetical protein
MTPFSDFLKQTKQQGKQDNEAAIDAFYKTIDKLVENGRKVGGNVFSHSLTKPQ